MFDAIKQSIVKEISSSVGQVINTTANQLQRKFMWFAFRTVALMLAIVLCASGVILLGAKYVGADLMFLTLGVLFLILFLVTKK
jgi:hypothetical protein